VSVFIDYTILYIEFAITSKFIFDIFIGDDLDQLMSVLTDHTMLSEEQQELWIEDGNGKMMMMMMMMIVVMIMVVCIYIFMNICIYINIYVYIYIYI
jgi:hypothetical protein